MCKKFTARLKCDNNQNITIVSCQYNNQITVIHVTYKISIYDFIDIYFNFI